MSRVRTFLLPIQLSMVLSLSAQADVHQLLHTATQLALLGHSKEAVEQARPLLESTQLSEPERGRGRALLGFAYQYQGEFQEAMSAYENALRILKERNEDPADYASALTALGTLYRDMRQFDAAAQMQMHALHVEQQINDHGGIAVVCANLADLELGSKHIRKAQAWLDEAVQESKLASNLDQKFYAFVASSEAWLAELKGNTRAAIAGHQKEIGYLAHSPGEQNPTLGWAYMLLGKAYLKTGNITDALSNMGKGCAILRQAGPESPRYLLAQVEYAEALESAGMHAEAVQTKFEAEGKLRVLYKEQCTRCRITSMALH